jgi:hypothetical protein
MKGFLYGLVGVILAFVIPLGILYGVTKLMDTREKQINKTKNNEDQKNQGR